MKLRKVVKVFFAKRNHALLKLRDPGGGKVRFFQLRLCALQKIVQTLCFKRSKSVFRRGHPALRHGLREKLRKGVFLIAWQGAEEGREPRGIRESRG